MPLISKKSRYALHGLAYIASRATGEPVPFHEILAYLTRYSGQLSLSSGYINKIFQDISRAGLTQAAPGPRGGYLLARPPGRIRLIEVVEALDGPISTGCCLLSVGSCGMQDTCGVAGIIHEAEAAFHRFFERQTLATLARRMQFPDPEPLAISPPGGRKPGTR